jgi:hypothetical protein
VYAYAELSYVRRVSDSVDLGVRLTAQISTAQLFGQPVQPAGHPAKRFRQLHTQYLESTQTLGNHTADRAQLRLDGFRPLLTTRA